MPYIAGSGRIQDVYHSPNVYANNVLIALWQAPGGTGAYSLNVNAPSVVIADPESIYVLEQTDVDSVDSTTSSTYETYVNNVVTQGVSSGVMSGATTSGTTIGTADTTPPPGAPGSTSTAVASQVVKGDWSQFNQDNIPYATLMLTEKTSLAEFTLKSALWGNQPKPFGPNSPQPGAGDNKHIKEQDIYIKGKGVVGRITVPQILHNLSNLAKNIWEPFKAKYPRAILTNTFRQNPPGGSSQQAQHGLGMALDMQIPGGTAEDYLAATTWIRDNLPFDQLLQEKAGSTRWIHVSHYSGFGYQVPAINKVANCVVSPTYSFVPGLSLLA